MEIFQATQKGPLKVPGYIDPNEVVTVKVYWGAPVFQANTVYRVGDICRPIIDNGYYYECKINGRSDATEPAEWSQETQISGNVEFAAVPYDLFVLPGETITSSTWAVTDKADVFVLGADYAVGDTCRPTTYAGYYYECTSAGNVGPTEPVSWSTTEQVVGDATFAAIFYVDIADATADTISTTVNINSVPKGAADFVLTNHVVKSNGEERDRSFKYKVHEQ